MDQDLRLKAVEHEIKEVKNTLNTLIDSVDKLNSGLYDDDENNHVGIITKYRQLRADVDSLIKANTDRAQETKVVSKWYEFGKDAVKMVIQIAAMYLILRGLLSPDAVL